MKRTRFIPAANAFTRASTDYIRLLKTFDIDPAIGCGVVVLQRDFWYACTEENAMTDPASAIKRELEILIDQQIITLKQSTSLTPAELTEYHTRSAKLDILYRELDRRKSQPKPIHRSKYHVHPAV